jgi:hypothetical protein
LFTRSVEQYTLTVSTYFLDEKDFRMAQRFYFGSGREDILGFTVANRVERWVDIYLPKTSKGEIDALVLGHEFGHALDFVSQRDRLGYPMLDPDMELGMGRLILPESTVQDFRLCEHIARERYRRNP